MPDYPNPYDFIHLTNQKLSRHKWDPVKDRIDGCAPDRFSGRLHCVLHPETPLFVHGINQQGKQERSFFRMNEVPVIPASTLKGALRSIYETVSGSCLSTIADRYELSDKQFDKHFNTYKGISWEEYSSTHASFDVKERIPEVYRPCTSLDAICPACLLFGMIERQEDGRPLAGRLALFDAYPIKEDPIWLKIPAAGGGPHPWHRTFYFDNSGQGHILGRKLYYHHRDYQATLALYGDGGRGGLIQVEGQQGDFKFTIDFQNLTEDELNTLVYTIALESDLRHHLGYGKPYGLGSAQIRIEAVHLWERPGTQGGQRFLTFRPKPTRPSDLQQWIQKRVDKTRQQWETRFSDRTSYIQTVGQFRRILHWPGQALYKYPSFDWFRRTRGSGEITLAEYQQGVREPNRGNRP
ncbi:MAG: hypothetical protein DYG89_41370 [Caldilinea sp. CFX5]|nr:hypothetical protein [Caldilinea sp. CFX5]